MFVLLGKMDSTRFYVQKTGKVSLQWRNSSIVAVDSGGDDEPGNRKSAAASGVFALDCRRFVDAHRFNRL